MFEEIDGAAKHLADTKAGWVDRRDGAATLGKAAAKALAALKAHEDEPDVDVRRAVEKALGEASAALTGVEPESAEPGKLTLEQLVRACERPGKREVQASGNGFLVKVRTKGGRTQDVYVMPVTRLDGIELIRVYTLCGPASPEMSDWAMRTNAKLAQCAFALWEQDGEEQMALMNMYLAEDTTPREIHVAIKEIAYYGDWVEHKITGEDEL